MSTPESPAVGLGSRRPWTSAEDELLTSLVHMLGDARGPQGRWKDISIRLPGRTPKDCRKRWFHSLDPSLRKGRWTEEEDQALMQAFDRLGPAWSVIASIIPGRKDDQCAKRYNDILDPTARDRLSNWSPKEDEILRHGVHTLGNRWSAISRQLPGRPPLTCRNRWRVLSRNKSGQTTTEEDVPNAFQTPMSSRPDDSRPTSVAPSSTAIPTGTSSIAPHNNDSARPVYETTQNNNSWYGGHSSGSFLNEPELESYINFGFPDDASVLDSLSLAVQADTSPSSVLAGNMHVDPIGEDSHMAELTESTTTQSGELAVDSRQNLSDNFDYDDGVLMPLMEMSADSVSAEFDIRGNGLSETGVPRQTLQPTRRRPAARRPRNNSHLASHLTRVGQQHRQGRYIPSQTRHVASTQQYEQAAEQTVLGQQSLEARTGNGVHIHHHFHYHHHHYHHHNP